MSVTVVTEEELAQALEDGEELRTPPGPASAGSTNGVTEADSENDPLNYSMEETKYVKKSSALVLKSML